MNKNRLERIIANMHQEGLSQLIVSAPASIYYLTGLWVEPLERLLALYLDDQGQVTLFANEIFGLTATPGMGLVLHKDSHNPLGDLAQIVKPGKLGIDKFWPSKFLIGLMEARQDILPVLGSGPVDNTRMIKDAQEREALRHASQVNDQVVMAGIQAIQEGMTEKELWQIINRQYLQHGADGGDGPMGICFGANCADPHHQPDQTVLQPGDSVIQDIFTPVKKYWCDMTRTVFFKQASPEQRQVYELVKKANQAAMEMVRPGIRISDLDRKARQIIAEGGYGQYFTHRLGHGIGLECHEIPDISSATSLKLQAGMVHSIEPGIYLPGHFGVRIEDLVLVTEDGCEALNKAPRELQIVH